MKRMTHTETITSRCNPAIVSLSDGELEHIQNLGAGLSWIAVRWRKHTMKQKMCSIETLQDMPFADIENRICLENRWRE